MNLFENLALPNQETFTSLKIYIVCCFLFSIFASISSFLAIKQSDKNDKSKSTFTGNFIIIVIIIIILLCISLSSTLNYLKKYLKKY